MASLNKGNAGNFVKLVRAAERYFRHPDVEYNLGRQQAGHAATNLSEVAEYVQDHVVEEGKKLSERDLSQIRDTLKRAAYLLRNREVAKIGFALPSTAVADRLEEAAKNLRR
jgi:hypothetical protein